MRVYRHARSISEDRPGNRRCDSRRPDPETRTPRAICAGYGPEPSTSTRILRPENWRFKKLRSRRGEGVLMSKPQRKTKIERKRTQEKQEIGITEARSQLRMEDIADRAYQLFLERGSEHGHDLEDWLAAERII